MARTVRFRGLDGSALLELVLAGDGTGYEVDIDGVNPGPTVWRRLTVTSPWADGFSSGLTTKDGRSFEITLRVIGTSNLQVEQLLQDLLAVVEAPAYLIEVEVDGVSTVWRADCADSSWSWASTEMQYTFRTVQLTIPTQPTPAITGL